MLQWGIIEPTAYIRLDTETPAPGALVENVHRCVRWRYKVPNGALLCFLVTGEINDSPLNELG